MPAANPLGTGYCRRLNASMTKWWASNADFDIPRMRSCFASGDKFLQNNLNGHTYRSVDELTRLWKLIGRRTMASPSWKSSTCR